MGGGVTIFFFLLLLGRLSPYRVETMSESLIDAFRKQASKLIICRRETDFAYVADALSTMQGASAHQAFWMFDEILQRMSGRWGESVA